MGEEKQSLVDVLKKWLNVELEYLKLTAAEKISLLVSGAIIAVVATVLGLVAFIILSFALVDLFATFMCHALACVTVGGILLLIIALLYLFRVQILVNPITKIFTRIILSPKKK